MSPEPGGRGSPAPGKGTGWGLLVLVLALVLALSYLTVYVAGHGLGEREIPYSEFKQRLAAGELRDLRIGEERIHGKLVPAKAAPAKTAPGGEGKPPASSVSEPATSGESEFSTVRVEDPDLLGQLEAAKVRFAGEPKSSFPLWLLFWLAPGVVLVFLALAALRRAGGAGPGGAAMSFGRSRARLVADLHTGVAFDDVAGCDEAKVDLQEVVQFLRQPERYEKLGARIPKGVLLVGPPGTGKTLLARAVAGEAQVPFYSISGSGFVEMFVGVGAARVRDLFEQAQKRAPCIVFIDEIDAMGRSRGLHIGAVNDEREQTLNQLLVEMDGFEPNSGVVLLAATNRPDVLDRALLRPGRFDRQVVLDLPDLDGRQAILAVHARGKPLAADVDLGRLARTTPGFSGADLANALNEAALLAARRGGATITPADLEAAIEKLVAGPERKSRRLGERARRRVAFHESGHALVAHLCPHGDTVQKISIVPRGRAALGYTMQLPEEERPILTRSELDDRVTGLLGGRAAEVLVFGEASTGAANDLEHATNLVRQMVCLYGMGASAGLMRCAHDEPGRPPLVADNGMQRDCSEHTARRIDDEVRQILEDAQTRATELLGAHRPLLERLAAALLERETLDGAAFRALVGSSPGALDARPPVAGAHGAPP